MRVDPTQSEYHESPTARNEFNTQELRNARLILRRLRFLEKQVRDTGGLDSGSGGAAFAVWEVAALEWVLGPHGIDFLGPKKLPAKTGASQ